MSLGDQLAISSRGNQQALEKQSACTQQQSPARHLLPWQSAGTREAISMHSAAITGSPSPPQSRGSSHRA